MKKAFLLSIIAAVPFLVLSQINTSKEFSYSISKPYKVIDASQKYYFAHNDDIFMIKIEKKDITIQKFNVETLELKFQKDLKGLPDDYAYEHITIINNKFYFFYSLWDKPNETEQLFYKEIDFETGNFVGDAKLLIKVKGKITGNTYTNGGYSIFIAEKFKFNYSYDSTKIMVQYRRKSEIKNDALNYDVIGFNVFDNNFKPLWNKEVKMPYTEKKMDNIDYAIDAEGNIFILTSVYDDNTTKKKNKEGEANYHIEILRVNANSDKTDNTKITLGDKFINKIYLYESPQNYMVCAGFYSNEIQGKNKSSNNYFLHSNYEENSYNTNGIFLFKVGKTGEAYDIGYHEIPVEVLNQYEKNSTQEKNEKKDKKDKAEFENLTLKSFIIGSDGSIVLIGEQDYSVTTTTTSTNSQGHTSTSSRTVFYSKDMLVTKIGVDGKLAWMKKLPKYQQSASGFNGISFKYLEANGKHYMLFLDNIKNINLALDQRPARHLDGQGGFLTAYQIDHVTGEVTKLSIFDTKNVKGTEVFQFCPDRIFSLSQNEFALEAYKKSKQDLLIKITLNKE